MADSLISSVALDLGTTSIKSGLLSPQGVLNNIITLPAPKIIAKGGCYESNALTYAISAERALNECLAQGKKSALPLGMCSQRSSFLIWNKADGRPLTPLISWQDNRGASSCEDLLPNEGEIRELTGLQLTPYYFAPKLRVVLQQYPEWRVRLENGELLLGTLDTFLIWRWSSGKYHVTDASMAARTLLMDIHQLQWSPKLGHIFGIPIHILPQIKPSADMSLQLDNGLTLKASGGDQSAAFIASAGEDSTKALVNLGTGGFVMRYIQKTSPIRDGYLKTLVFQDGNQQAHIAIEGTLNSIAAALAPYPITECRACELATQNIFCLAEPSGLGAPYFRSDFSIYFSHDTNHLTTHQVGILLLEAIIFRVVRILEDFHHESPLASIYLSGGLSEIDCLRQGIALCAPATVYRLNQKDSSLLGVACLAAGIWPGMNQELSRVIISGENNALGEKYLRWKVWLDSLLG